VKEATIRGRARDAPLIGREEEVGRLLALWEQVLEQSRPALGMLLGDPGIGKSRLLTEVAHRAASPAQGEPMVLWGRCLSYGEGITYWPVEEILEGAAGVLRNDDRETVSAKIATLLDGLDIGDPDHLRTIAATFENLFGTARAEQPASATADISQAELHWGIRRVLELLAAKRPLVLVFEDLHWAEPTLFDLIDFIGEASGPILMLGSARRELRELRQDFCVDTDRRTTISLAALGEEESEALLGELLGARGLPVGSTKQLLRNAGGNPLFLEETVRMLDDAGILDGEGDLSDVTVPTNLQAMIGSRLDSLPATDKRVAHHASVVGMVFWSGAVSHLHGAGTEVDPSLESLEEREFVRGSDESSLADEREWAFRHGLIRDVAYSRVPKGRRAHLHVGFADWVHTIPGAAEELVEVIAYHLEQACRHAGVGRSEAPPPVARAVEALTKAAEKAERREGIREADRYYARALELVGDDMPETTLELSLHRAGTLNRLGQLAHADELLAHVAEQASGIGRSDLRAKALVSRANIAGKQGRAAEARAHIGEAEAIATELGDRSVQVRAIYEATDISSWFDGDLEAATDDLRRGLGIAEELEDNFLQAEGHLRLIVAYYNLGNLREAEAQLVRCSDLLREYGSLRDEARATFQFGLVKYHLGEVEEAERFGLLALDWLDRTGEKYWQLQNLRTLALCAVARSDLKLAEERLGQAITLALEIGGWVVIEIYRCLVDVLIRQGRLSDARDVAELAARSVPEEDPYARAACLLIDGQLTTADARLADASARYGEAMRLLEQQQMPLDLSEARLAFGRALRSLGDNAGAAAELEKAREDLDRMGARGLVGEVDRELAELRRELEELGEGAGTTGPLTHS
jgi:tetratricopeptide (TPR) repeat protein